MPNKNTATKNNITHVQQDVLLDIYNQFTIKISSLMDGFVDSLTSVLFVFEASNTNDYKLPLNYQAVKILIDNHQKIVADFLASIGKAIEYFHHGDFDFFINENTNINSIKTVKSSSKTNKEASVILQLIDKTENQTGNHLHKLGNIFSELAQNKSLNFNQIPISPFVVVNSFANSIKKLDINITIKAIAYNTFDVNVLDKLNALYVDIVNNNRGGLTSVDGIDSSKNLINLVDSKYFIITKLFNRYHYSKSTNAISNTKDTIERELIIQTLTMLQEKILKKNKVDKNLIINNKVLKRMLSQGVAQLDKNVKNKKFSQADLDVINLVSMLFQYISNDKSIQTHLKSLLIRLQIPILKIALQDNSLFKNTSHPIRLLVNQMSYVPDGFSDDLSVDNKFIIKLNEIVNVILIQNSYNFTLYENLLDELEHYTNKMKIRFNLIQKRVKEKAIGLEKIAHVKSMVSELLDKKMHDRYMPVFVRDLLLNSWKNVLVLEYLRHPAESKYCQSKVQFVDTLLDCSRATNTQKISADEINNISTQFCEGLDLVAFNSKDLSDKNDELVSLLIKIHGLEKTKSKINKNKFKSNETEVILYLKDQGFENDRQQVESINDSFDARSRSLKVGDWLNFSNDESKQARAKISWISPISGRYLLVNSNGVRLSDKSPEEIAEGFRNKTCSELQVVPLFDRALLEIAKEMNDSIKIEKIVSITD